MINRNELIARLGRVGVWGGGMRSAEDITVRNASREIETLGFRSIWIPGLGGGALFEDASRILDSSSTVTVGTSVLNIWLYPAAEVAEEVKSSMARFPGRLVLGIGVSHASFVEGHNLGSYQSPITSMVNWLQAFDAAYGPGAPSRLLAALGPKMLACSAEHADGAHPYLVPVEHTRLARSILGGDAVLAPEMKAIMLDDEDEARKIARKHLRFYLERLPNYVKNLERLGFSADDMRGGGSDRLVDSLVAWGKPETIVARIREHLDAGADHVAVQIWTADRLAITTEEWRVLARALNEQGLL